MRMLGVESRPERTQPPPSVVVMPRDHTVGVLVGQGKVAPGAQGVILPHRDQILTVGRNIRSVDGVRMPLQDLQSLQTARQFGRAVGSTFAYVVQHDGIALRGDNEVRLGRVLLDAVQTVSHLTLPLPLVRPVGRAEVHQRRAGIVGGHIQTLGLVVQEIGVGIVETILLFRRHKGQRKSFFFGIKQPHGAIVRRTIHRSRIQWRGIDAGDVGSMWLIFVHSLNI